MTITSNGLYLGFDYGARRIGVAVGDGVTRQARPLPTVANGREPDWTTITKLLKDWRPSGVVVGLPIDLDGNDQAITGQAKAFAASLRVRFGVPTYLCDERMSSRAADDEIRTARADGRMTRKTRKGDRDGVAARIILEQWLNDSTTPVPPETAAQPSAADAAHRAA
jgi:putative Holliday junction resolvase